MSTRNTNERKFKLWKQTETGGRLYWRKVIGNQKWYAIYYKEVDTEETTIRFWQEIYNDANVLLEIHEKYPEDKGHKKLFP